MLDQNTLAQLRGLKSQMESEKERAEGVVRGTDARYGFARLDDGREVFLPPDEMLKVFPGDRVRLNLRDGKDKRPVGEVESLVSSPVNEFTGRCVRKGKALFVEPDLPEARRWMFLPPGERGNLTAGDYLRCAVRRHPIRDGRPQARVLERIGGADDPGIENRYTMARHGLVPAWPAAALERLATRLAGDDPTSDAAREDFTGLAFVSIDAARTLDIDDALYAEVTSEGWLLYVAIADPTAYIDAASPLREIVGERASSMYFHGTVVPMLPDVMAQQRCALTEGELRPALVCRIAVNEAGEIGDATFVEARIRSRAKLSYYAVDRYLGGHDASLMSHSTPLEALYQVSRALRARREREELVMEDRQEYRWIMNERGHIETIEPCDKLRSQRLVEECMIAANRCAARLLVERGAAGPFVVHDGFRRDRLKERAAFVDRYLPQAREADADSLEGYRQIMRAVQETEHELPLRSMLNRLLTRARIAKNPGAHMGMGVPVYTNCTSPLRKYLDFLVHLQLKAILHGETATLCQQPELDALSRRLQKLREVSQEAERWLGLIYLQKMADSGTQTWSGRVAHLGIHGFRVRLDANGLEGFVDLRDEPGKFRVDRATATVESKSRLFRVDMPVTVTFAGEHPGQPHLAHFRLDPAAGRKAGRATGDAAQRSRDPGDVARDAAAAADQASVPDGASEA